MRRASQWQLSLTRCYASSEISAAPPMNEFSLKTLYSSTSNTWVCLFAVCVVTHTVVVVVVCFHHLKFHLSSQLKAASCA